jgi:Mor family transcriptional regulator
MSYIKATDVLPEEVLDLIQKYVEGEYIYIPKKECNRKLWGQTTKSKEKTSVRNEDIYKTYEEGVSIKILSEMYYLSSKSIQKIVLKMKKENE